MLPDGKSIILWILLWVYWFVITLLTVSCDLAGDKLLRKDR